MLYGLLSTLFVLLCFLIVAIILLQKSKGSLGIIGSAGSGAQMLFGGSGGQDVLQKVTWSFIGLFLVGSFALALLKNRSANESRFLGNTTTTTASSVPLTQPASPAPTPVEQTAPTAQ